MNMSQKYVAFIFCFGIVNIIEEYSVHRIIYCSSTEADILFYFIHSFKFILAMIYNGFMYTYTSIRIYIDLFHAVFELINTILLVYTSTFVFVFLLIIIDNQQEWPQNKMHQFSLVNYMLPNYLTLL